MKVAFNFKEGKRMSRKERIWYEESGNRLDPGLIEQLRQDRRNVYQATGTSEIPIIIKCRQGCQDADTRQDQTNRVRTGQGRP